MKRLATLALLALIPISLNAQAKKGLRATMARANATADSAKFNVEFGSDIRVTQSGDSLPADVRLGVILGSSFTIEGSVAAQQEDNYTEADASLGLTAAVFPGATTNHGQFVHAAIVLHYEGTAFQPGIKFGSGNRQVASTAAGALLRMSAGVEHLFQRGALGAHNVAYVEVGLSFLK